MSVPSEQYKAIHRYGWMTKMPQTVKSVGFSGIGFTWMWWRHYHWKRNYAFLGHTLQCGLTAIMERLNLMVAMFEAFYFHKIEACHLVQVHWNSPSVSRDTSHVSSCCCKLPSDLSEPKPAGLCWFNSEHSNCLKIKGKSDVKSSKKSTNYRDLLRS